MQYLSVENFQLLIKVLKIKSDEKIKLLYHIMNFISKQNKTIIEGNKLAIDLFKSSIQQDTHPLEHLDIPEAIKRSVITPITEQRNTDEYFINNDLGDYMQDIYRKTNNYFQNFEAPDGVDQSKFLIEKSDKLKQLEDDLFNYYQREYIYVFDSRDRNQNDYPNANTYRLQLSTQLQNVHTINVLSAEIPNSGYIINDSNNTIYFKEGTEIIEASIINGNYTIDEIINNLQSSMNSVGNSTYNITISNNRIKITSDLTGGDNLFTLIFNGGTEITTNGKTRSITYKNNIGKILGFENNNFMNGNSYTATKMYNVSPVNNLYMTISNLPYKRYYTNDGFVKITMKKNHGEICYYKDSGFNHEFYPSLHSIEYLDIKWTDYQDVLYDFNGLEHSFMLKFTCYIS